MISSGYSDRIYRTTKLEPIVGFAREEGVSITEALRAADLCDADISSPETLVSIDQILTFYRQLLKSVDDPDFAYKAGSRFHLTTYGMYGFAMLSSTNYRRALQFWLQYHQLSTPLIQDSFKEVGPSAIWRITPIPHPQMVGALYEFVVELHLGIQVSILRDLMGESFHPTALTFTFGPPPITGFRLKAFGCPAVYQESENGCRFDASWLDRPPRMGSPSVNAMMIAICDEQLEELKAREGLAGRVRTVLIETMGRRVSLAAVAMRLNMSERSLRRRLMLEGTSFQELYDELRMHAAIQYLRDTAMRVDEIAEALAFSDATNFRRAFRRWTSASPQAYRSR